MGEIPSLVRGPYYRCKGRMAVISPGLALRTLRIATRRQLYEQGNERHRVPALHSSFPSESSFIRDDLKQLFFSQCAHDRGI